MDWWLIEYDNRKLDSHLFSQRLFEEVATLFITARGGPQGAAVYTNVQSMPDNKMRFYFNAKAVEIPGIFELLSIYRAKKTTEPTEMCSIFAGNQAEPLTSA